MAQYFTDFADSTPGDAPVGWTSRGSAFTEMLVYASDPGADLQDDGYDLISGNSLVLAFSSGPPAAVLSWDAVDADSGRGEAEMLVRARRRTSAQVREGFAVRGSGAVGSTTEYLMYGDHWATSGLRFSRVLSGARSTIATLTAQAHPGTHVWYWMRARVSGSTLEIKRWLDTDEEPTSWQLTSTDANISAAGWLGFTVLGQINSRVELDVFGAGTDGDPAPTGPVEVSAEPFLLRHNPRLNKVIPVLSFPTVTDIGANCVRPRVTKGY